ncbi:hypothetical protein ACSSS7_001608 [Eimeria intestinalis]
MSEKEEIAADFSKGEAEGTSSRAAPDRVLEEVAESDPDAQNTEHTSETHLPGARPPRPASVTQTMVSNLAAAAGIAYTEPSQTQQTQNDTGSVEQQRAMELLRSVDEEGEARGQVIVCSANDEDDDESLPPTPTAVALARPPSADIDARQATEVRSHSLLGEAETGMQATRPHATTNADEGEMERDGATEAGHEQVSGTDDAYMAQLTMRALDREREEMLKELEAYPELEFLRREYEKLHHQLKIAQKNETELKAKCLEMSAAMASNATQVHAALEEAGSEEETIKRLKRDLSACLIEVANGKAREAAETKAANQLRKQIEELYRSVMKVRKNEELYTTQEQLQDRRAAAEEEAKKRERVERQLKQNKAHVEQQQQELAKKQAELIAALQEQLANTQQQIQQEVQQAQEVQKRIQAENDKRQIESLLRERFRRECQQLQQKVETLEAERDRYGHTLNKSNQKYLQVVEQLKNEELKVAELQRSIGEQHSKLSAQKTLYEAILAERDMLGTQLLKRTQELSLLHEKVRIHESTLAKGEAQYKSTLNNQPGAEVFEQMQNLQSDVRTKTKQLRAAASELQVLHKEAVKNCYVEEKRREAREQQLKLQEEMQQQPSGDMTRSETFFSSSTFEYLTGVPSND